jgi:hypothetical protein
VEVMPLIHKASKCAKRKLQEAEEVSVMKKTLVIIALTTLCVASAVAHNSYTGGYSGAPGAGTCASSCHGGTSGTIQVTGFPASYTPGQTYTITVSHNGGNKIVNVNATTRLGTTATVAGTFTAGSNTAVYTGSDGGIYAGTHLVDVLTFQWKAPAAKSGQVKFFSSGFQATSTGTSSGQSNQVNITSTEVTTGVVESPAVPRDFVLSPNFPNPFNPSTHLQFSVPENGYVTLKVFNIQGEEIATLYNGMAEMGRTVQVTFNAGNMPSGIYLSRLEFNGRRIVQKMLLTK